MTRIALFHSVLGIRPGVLAAADVFRGAGHEVEVVDQYEGRVFDDYAEAGEFVQTMGYPELMASALRAVANDAGPLVTAGFSNGAGLAGYVAAARGGPAGGVLGSLQFSGALPLEMTGVERWPVGTPVQLHYAVHDPFRNEAWVSGFVRDVEASGSPIEAFLDYPIAGHLFTDASLPDEFDEASAALAFERALVFLDHPPGR
jgi:dienelactone hydrolase